jgi:hypothetical protein
MRVEVPSAQRAALHALSRLALLACVLVSRVFSGIQPAQGRQPPAAHCPESDPPSGCKIGNPPVYYDVSTTAGFSGPVTLCFSWQEGQYSNENNIKLFHFENGTWMNVTTSRVTRFSFVHMAWVGVLLFACVDLWFSLWGLREREAWSLIYVLYLLVLATVLYVACQLIVPDLRDGDSIDLVAFNETRRRKYLAALGLDVALAMVQNFTTPGLATANVFNVALVALIGIAWLWRDTRVQIAVVAVFIAIYTYYAATYIPKL